MRAVAVAFLLMALMVAVARAAPADVVIRSRLDPAEGAVIGQPVRLLVDVLFPDAMPHPPRVKPPSVAGAQLFRFETQGVTIRERISGRDHVGQRFEFALFPRRAGAFAIPGAEVTLLDPSGETSGAATAEPLHMTASAPPGLDASGPVIASTKVSARQSWSPDPSAVAKPGGALVRTIERSAAGVPALAIAELAFQAPEGVRVYVDPSVSEDRVNRGVLTGRRTDKVTYVFEREGAYALPALFQPWWDLDGREARTENLLGVEIKVVAGLAPPFQALKESWRRPLLLAAPGAAALLAILFVGPRAAGAFRAWRVRRSRSEAAARRALRDAARSGDAARTFRALQVWRSRMSPAQLVRNEADAAFALSVAKLERALFGSGEDWSQPQARDLARLVTTVGPVAAHSSLSQPALPPLNPARSPRVDHARSAACAVHR